MSVTTYKTIEVQSCGEYKEKNSRFIAFAYPVKNIEEAHNLVKDLKGRHSKARHWCYAYRIGLDGLQFRMNDDGEPSGSAGRPILGQIDSLGLTDILVVVVRYFGGVLLGVPGLINAYKNAAIEALMEAQIVEKNIEKTVWIICTYADLNGVLRIVKQHQAVVVKQDLQMDCRLMVRVPLVSYEHCLNSWLEMRDIVVQCEPFD